MGYRCDHCKAAVTLVADETLVRRHVSPLVPRDAPRADRVCPNSGMPAVGRVVRTADHWAEHDPREGFVGEGVCVRCGDRTRANEAGALRHVYELEVMS